MTRKRNEGGRFSAKTANDWYREIEEENIRRIEAEWAAREEAEYHAQAGHRNLTETEWQATLDPEEYGIGTEDDGDLVPWDRAA
jgi:type I restriction-modification system DNA methylase subunit